jgi:Ran GTPase-activating protein (RanGAP) involved in mRNA processing and transport
MNNMQDNSDDLLYAALKVHQNLVSLQFNNLTLTANDAKAIGKVLSDFKQIRELDLTNAALSTITTKDIADGLMRAKALEIIKVGNNPLMGKSVNAIIYNLAFSPKIRLIDLENMKGTDADTAEALYKLLNISGSIETLNLYNADIVPHVKEDFWKAVGQNKTLRYLNLSLSTQTCNQQSSLAKAISMNGKKQGNLKAVAIENWFTTYSSFVQFLESLKVSEKEHEYWYGDKNVASKMTKEDVYDKNIHFALDYLNLGGDRTNLSGMPFRPKQILAQVKPVWPTFLEVAHKCKELILNLDNSKMSQKDMELVAYAIGENPMGACNIKQLNLRKCPINKEGAKFLAPALAFNKSLVHLDLSSCKLGVSGVMRLSDSMKENKTLKSINLYRNILDVDGARAIGKMLEVNKTIEFIDIGHNRIRETGLKAIVDGV